MELGPVVIGSKNPDKVAEVREVLAGLGVEVAEAGDWPDVDETEDTLEGNALLKARAVAAATGRAALADDTGLEVAALDGAPGVRSARYSGEGATYASNRAKLRRELAAEPDRRARFRTVVALVTPAGDEIVAEGSVDGLIVAEERGEHGFGYDALFEVEGRTFAEMTAAEKHQVSHRARALRALAAELRERMA